MLSSLVGCPKRQKQWLRGRKWATVP